MNTPGINQLIRNIGKGNTVDVGIMIINPDPALPSGRQDGTRTEKGEKGCPGPRMAIGGIFGI